jgi:uncharacterized membrane protein
MSRLAIALGIVILVIAVAASPMPLSETLDNSRHVVIYPNLLFAVPLVLLGVLLLLYGLTSKKQGDMVS